MSAPPAPGPHDEDRRPGPLAERLIGLIAEGGPIPVGDFMSDALAHPQYGYYATKDPFGVAGDFTTAPGISQLFGELVGAALVDAWTTIGEPSLFQLVEFGPGRGTLMNDILRVGALRPAFLEAARISLIENSGRLRLAQQRLLGERHPHIAWRQSLDEVPGGPILGVANEFFDCLPIRQFVKVEGGEMPWRERLVGLNDARNGFAYVLSETPYAHRPGMPSTPAPVETLFEECASGQEIVRALSVRLRENKGRVLIADYGHGRPGFGDTFQAVKRHDYWHPLAEPGEADITAHVDFGALARAGREEGVRVDGPVRQGDFLMRLGLAARLERLLGSCRDDEQKKAIALGADRLVDPDAMGHLFKVLSLSSPGLPEPPGFS